jgi:uncharacterized damage-inducible protein DinB
MMKVPETIEKEKFQSPLIAGGNSPSWILGHLVDTDDELISLLGAGPRKHPELSKIYHHERGQNQQNHLNVKELAVVWKEIVAELDHYFNLWTEQDWLSRHMAVSEEDFKKEPQRNRLNVMLSRVTHKASHLGQIAMMR